MAEMITYVCDHCEKAIDSRSPVTACPQCASENICDTFHLSGRQCPYCRTGSFTEDPFGRAIS